MIVQPVILAVGLQSVILALSATRPQSSSFLTQVYKMFY